MNFDEYRQYDAIGLADLIAKGEVTADELLDVAIERCALMDPVLGIITVDDEDFARARVADDLNGPLAGVPFLLKDLYAFLEGTVFTCGSRLLGQYRAPMTSTFVQRCLDAGLVPFGKTKSPEFGVNVVSEPVATGPCRNPWDTTRSPGGSSGGAGAAVAAGIVPMAHASDGGGSIRIPASACGLFGLKPSRARMPVGPIAGEAWNGLATSHVLTRSVRDCAFMLDLAGGPEPGDPYACPQPAAPFLEQLDQTPDRLRIGISDVSPFGTPIDQDCVNAVRETARLLSDLGHTLEEASPVIDAAALIDAQLTIVSVNQANDLDTWSKILGRPFDATLIEANTLELAERGRRHTGQEFSRAVSQAQLLARSFGRFFQNYDMWLTPTLGTVPMPIGRCDQNGASLKQFLDETINHIPFTALYNLSGCPAVSVPLFWNTDGLPIGSMLGAALGQEHLLLQVCRELELSRPWFTRVPV